MACRLLGSVALGFLLPFLAVESVRNDDRHAAVEQSPETPYDAYFKARTAYFKVLGLNPEKMDISESEIKNKFQSKALQYHPDKNLGNEDEAKERMQALNSAKTEYAKAKVAFEQDNERQVRELDEMQAKFPAQQPPLFRPSPPAASRAGSVPQRRPPSAPEAAPEPASPAGTRREIPRMYRPEPPSEKSYRPEAPGQSKMTRSSSVSGVGSDLPRMSRSSSAAGFRPSAADRLGRTPSAAGLQGPRKQIGVLICQNGAVPSKPFYEGMSRPAGCFVAPMEEVIGRPSRPGFSAGRAAADEILGGRSRFSLGGAAKNARDHKNIILPAI